MDSGVFDHMLISDGVFFPPGFDKMSRGSGGHVCCHSACVCVRVFTCVPCR